MLRLRTHPSSRSFPRFASGSLVASAAGLLVSAFVVAVLGTAVGANDPIGLDLAVDRLVPHPGAGDGALLGSLLRDLGGEKGAFMIAAVGGLFAWIRGREWVSGVSLIAAYTGASATTFILKAAIGRRGPHALDPTGPGFSFPSAHTARVVAVLGLLVVLTMVFASPKVGIVLGAAGASMVAAMMVSQLIERHHWLTDQIGGIAIGTAWVFIMVPVVLHLAGRPAHGMLVGRAQADRRSAKYRSPIG